MSQDNRVKPTVRSGDDINPTLAKAIKIGGLLVMVALAVVIIFILIELFKKDDEQVELFKENHHLVLEDFEILINPDVADGIFENLNDTDVRDILFGLEENEYYIYFYYSDQGDKLTEDEITTIEGLDESYPLFIVDLSGEAFAEWLELSKWNDALITHEDMQIILDSTKTNSFIIELSLEGRLTETALTIFYGNSLLTIFE